MKTEKERKISFNTLVERNWKTKIERPFYLIEETIKYICKLGKMNRKMDLKDSKFCLLQEANFERKDDGLYISGFFKSAIDAFRPNLIDRTNGDERKSPKKLTEGDIEKTHFCVKLTKDEVFLALEINGNGISINQATEYFKKFSKNYCDKIEKSKSYSVFLPNLVVKIFLMH